MQTTTVKTYLETLASGQIDNLRPLLARDFSFSAPGVEVRSVDEFIGMIKEHLAPVIDGVDIKHVFSDDTQACAIFDLVTRGGRTRMAEHFKGTGDKISSINLIYDPAQLAAAASA